MSEQEKLAMESLDEVTGGKGHGFEFVKKFNRLSRDKQAAIIAAITGTTATIGVEVGRGGKDIIAAGKGIKGAWDSAKEKWKKRHDGNETTDSNDPSSQQPDSSAAMVATRLNEGDDSKTQ